MASDHTITVVQDSREKRPLLFPKTLQLYGYLYDVKLSVQAMDAGDYCILDEDGRPLTYTCIIERKASISEIHSNFFTADKHRMKRALDKLCEATDHPVLLFEALPVDILKPTKRIPFPGLVVQRLIDECNERRIEQLWVGACKFPTKRRAVGELVLRFLASYARQAGEI